MCRGIYIEDSLQVSLSLSLSLSFAAYRYRQQVLLLGASIRILFIIALRPGQHFVALFWVNFFLV